MDYNAVNTGLATVYIDNGYFEADKSFKSYVVLNVLVLPMEGNGSFLQTLFTNGRETSLKQIYSRNAEYWRAAFPKRSAQEVRSLSVYRKSLESIEGYSGKQLHILLLKSEGKAKRNPYALPLEQFCSTSFCGPLVVSLSLTESPYSLRSFKSTDMQILENINHLRGNNRPLPIPNTPAHTVQKEAPAVPNNQSPAKTNPSPKKKPLQPLKKPLSNNKLAVPTKTLEELYCEMSPETFFMYRFKTVQCPNSRVKHNTEVCLRAHWIYDYRRPPDTHYYIPEMCPLVDPNRGGTCKDGDKCGYSHSPLEKIYHPSRYRVFECPEKAMCMRKVACPFYHSAAERRNPVTLKVAEPPSQTFLSYAEPKAHCINIVTNYVAAMLKKREGASPEFKWTYISLRRSDDPNPETRSEDGNDSPRHERRRGSLGAPKDYFALFSAEEEKELPEPAGPPAETTGKIFIDDQYIDTTEPLGSIDDLGSDSKNKMALICDSICNSGSAPKIVKSPLPC
eukprot:TRINITY_DN13024_c0_g1_i6.p1 TRINITY_DN13024_c0_g1~~TRINITY_DN13024_c0_g1_i6.p1  ORF type:complete len:507 (+),score=131.69 TRINITY_DN13024_c0_g1_i6:115-1635(+)